MEVKAQSILADLVAFDTTSRNSNLALIAYVEAYLARYGVASRRVSTVDGKANLFATIGPEGADGIVLSGHTDVVPVDGQAWSSDPFALTRRGTRVYGRGTADMKGFLACVLASVPAFCAARLAFPIHLAFSYDEEVGCTGVKDLIADLAMRGFSAGMCLVGEPTGMIPVIAHKGGRAYRVTVQGLEAHSSLAPQGVNAIEFTARLIVKLREVAESFMAGRRDNAFDVPFSTLSTGLIEGGTGINIVPNRCSFVFEYRLLPGMDMDAVVNAIKSYADSVLLPEMRNVHPGSAISFEAIYAYPAHEITPDHEEVQRIMRMTGSNHVTKVAYGTEAGLFREGLSIPTVICGPGDISVAHKADEFVDVSQLERCQAMLMGLIGDRR